MTLIADALNALETGDPAGYDMAVTAGQTALDNMDAGRWWLGDLAGGIGKRYGGDSLGAFAVSVGIGKKALYEYRAVSAAFENSARVEFSDYPLRWSHFRLAARLPDTDARRDFLLTCADDALTVDAARIRLQQMRGHPTPPRTLIDVTCVCTQVSAVTGELCFRAVEAGADTLALADAAREGVRVRLVVRGCDAPTSRTVTRS